MGVEKLVPGLAELAESGDEDRMRREVQNVLRTAFLPEFLNRIDETIIFHPLGMGELKQIDYRGCIDAQILLGTAFRFMKRALAEIVATGSYTGFDDAAFTAVRKEIEDLIGLDAYYRIEAETVEPDSRPG